MSKKELKHEILLIEAKNRLTGSEYQKEMEADQMKLFDFVRPEFMIGDVFKNECKKMFDKHIAISQSKLYDEFESEIIKNTASRFLEFMLKAYLTMCYY